MLYVYGMISKYQAVLLKYRLCRQLYWFRLDLPSGHNYITISKHRNGNDNFQMARMNGEMREFEDIDGLRDEAARTKVCAHAHGRMDEIEWGTERNGRGRGPFRS